MLYLLQLKIFSINSYRYIILRESLKKMASRLMMILILYTLIPQKQKMIAWEGWQKIFIPTIPSEGRKEGREEGSEKLAQLMGILAENGRLEDIKKASKDKRFRKKLFRELNLM